MGPIQQFGNGSAKERSAAIKWIDNNKEVTQGPALVTSKSSDDLCKKESVEPVSNHKKQIKPKVCIKSFKLDINQLTGIANFS